MKRLAELRALAYRLHAEEQDAIRAVREIGPSAGLAIERDLRLIHVFQRLVERSLTA